MKINADWLTASHTQRVFSLLTEAGFQAFVVGGAVRNTLLDMAVSDLDFATDATPQQVIALAEKAGLRVVPTGIDHGTVTLILGGQGFEVTTFRHDLETDGRRAIVGFTTSMTEDAARRDFTMNALYCAMDGQVLDPVGGLSDLQAGRVAFVGNPTKRIAEDYLRILRFFRFYAWFGDPEGGPDPEGLAAVAAGADGIATLAVERIGAEMTKCLGAPNPAPALAAMAATGILARILPGASDKLLAPLIHFEHAAKVPPRWQRRLGAIGGQDIGAALRLSRADMRYITALTDGLAGQADTAELAYRQGADVAIDVALINAATTLIAPPPDLLETVERGTNARFPLRAADLDPSLKGREIGRALRRAEERWIASGFTLDRHALLT